MCEQALGGPAKQLLHQPRCGSGAGNFLLDQRTETVRLPFLGVRDETGTVQLEALGFSRDSQPLELVAIGAIAMLLFALGWALMAAAARRRARSRRDGREAERLAELERTAEADRVEQERRFEEASLRDEDLRSRESHLDAWAEELDTREREVARLRQRAAALHFSRHVNLR